MQRLVQGLDRTQASLLPAFLEDYVDADNAARMIEAFVAALDLARSALRPCQHRQDARAIIPLCCRSFTSTAIRIVFSRAGGPPTARRAWTPHPEPAPSRQARSVEGADAEAEGAGSRRRVLTRQAGVAHRSQYPTDGDRRSPDWRRRLQRADGCQRRSTPSITSSSRTRSPTRSSTVDSCQRWQRKQRTRLASKGSRSSPMLVIIAAPISSPGAISA